MKRILIVKPSSLGDIVHSLPVAAELSRRGYEVHFAARREYHGLLEMCPAVRRILAFPGNILEIPAFVAELRNDDYDRVIDLQGLLRSALAAAFARTSHRQGLPDAREGAVLFYDEISPYRKAEVHAVDRYRSVLGGLGEMGDPDFSLSIPSDAVSEAARLLGDPGYVILSPLARQARKLWPAEKWDELAAILRRGNVRLAVVGQGDEEWAAWRPEGTVNLINRTSLPVLCAILSRASAAVAVDSAPMHILAALNVPVVALFGPTDPAKIGPYGSRNRMIRSETRRMEDVSAELAASSVLSELQNR